MSDTKAQPSDLVQVTRSRIPTAAGPIKEGDKIKVRPDQLERLKNHHKV
ncbi:hypothetical protein [Halomonas ventosae]|uniref:Uncharacterized protein n=1 Tax=Halomonas ventosae TaxID=229007 RepID=A0A2T0VR28_9GAMM|nr:hypothetical protein [Halomonas ventosae]PRY72989.1 hypothetical protein BCL64_10268 [Halomonas ventosae]